MKNEIIDNTSENTNINLKNEQICPYCIKSISSELYKDHILCHQIEEGDRINNFINSQDKNDKIESDNKEENGDDESDGGEKNISDKIFGFFENIGNKAKNIFKKEEEKKINIQKKEENIPKKISNFFGNISNKISKTFNEIKEEFTPAKEENEENDENFLSNIRIINRIRRNRNNDYRNDNNIDELLIRFEEEDDKQKESLFTEDDAKEILRFIPTSIIKEEKNKNDNNYKCVICLYEFKKGDKVSTLPCLHIFHIDCLKNWIIRNRSCPICKFDCSLDSLLSNNNFGNE